ncbi:MAG: peptidase T [Elusimicrobiaceae bacterium]|nr:peptidase T [Elusimicrobiaceae bacterium]
MRKLWMTGLAIVLPLVCLAQALQDWKALSQYDKEAVKKQLTQRLTRYVTFDTQARESDQVPSTPGQTKLAKELAKELKKNGAQHVQVDKFSIVTAEIPSNVDKPTPTVAFLAHSDTALEASGRNVRPQIHSSYKGGPIVIDQAHKITLDLSNAPQLARAKGHDIITASGDTLLGADDKSGVAILLTLTQYFYDHPSLKHGPIKIVFTPDEETGAGIDHLDVAALGAQAAYTLDGSDLGELTDETFNAKAFTAVFEGYRAVHPGQAMHAPFADNVLMASDFHTLLPRYKRPENTAERRGFILVDSITTEADRTEVKGILRAFSDEEMKTLVNDVTQAFNTVKAMNYKGKDFSLVFTDQYRNMKSVLPPHVVKLAETAMRQEGITPKRHAARGGTDGAQLSFKGLPTPNLFSGQYNMHSTLEYADVDVMEASLRTVLRLAMLWAEQPGTN